MTSTDPKTWLVTGAGRGMGVDFAQAAPGNFFGGFFEELSPQQVRGRRAWRARSSPAGSAR